MALIQQHQVTHLKVVPALLIRLINDPTIGDYDLGSVQLIQSGGQRMQPEVRIRTRQLFRNAFVQENFGMSEGLIMFVRRGDPEEVLLETCGRPVCADDEVKLIDDDGRPRWPTARWVSSPAAARTRCAATTACPSTTRASSRPTASTAPAT